MPANQLPLKDLKSHLWNCAQILRGSAVDRTDWKGYILPLLFFKRISDVWDEETAEAREDTATSTSATFPSCTASRCRTGATGGTSAKRRQASAPRWRGRCGRSNGPTPTP